MTITAAATTTMPPVVVDRSPELARGTPAGYAWGGKIVTLTARGATPGDGEHCAVANIIRENFPGAREIHIEGEKPYLIRADGSRCELHLGADIIDWIGRLDRGEPVEDIEIVIDI